MAYLEFKPTSTLFQYCSFQAFKGIVSSKNLWFSDLASSNDPRELTFGFDNFQKGLKLAQEMTYGGPMEARIAFMEKRLVRYFIRTNVFCSCLSLARDELPMWAVYADSYMGVALGFRPTALADMPVRVQKVRYIPDNDDAGFVRLIIELAADLDFTKGIIEQIGVISGAFAAITAVKHETWSYEREIRLTHAQGKEPLPSEESPVFRMTALLPDDSPINWSEPLVRKTNGRQVGYLSFPYGRYSDKKFDARGAIETVILGPKCEASEADVECLLTAEGFRDFSVSRSRCQIR